MKTIHTIFSGLAFLGIVALLMPVVQVFAQAQPMTTVTDMKGRTVMVHPHTDRIVTTFKPATLLAFSLGLGPRLVGVDNESTRISFTTAIWPDIRNAAQVGRKSTGLNLETILGLKPDLVILYAQKDGVELADRLTSLGIPSIVILPEDFASLRKTLNLIAKAAGVPKKAEEVNGECDKILNLVQDRIKNISPEKRPTCYYAGSRGFFSTASGEMLQNEIMEKAGGINVSHKLSGYFREISPEQFISWNPDCVVYTRALRGSIPYVTRRAELTAVTAIAEKRLYSFPSRTAPWDFPSPLAVPGVLWLASHLYPEKFADLNVSKIIDDFHCSVFGKSLTEIEGEPDAGKKW